MRVERAVTGISECEFYHAVDLPGGGQALHPQWDLRPTVGAYLGNVDFIGKRVIEIGPASGFLSFHMERCGAHVVAVEPPLESIWDFIPRTDGDWCAFERLFKTHMQNIRNGFWFLHGLYRSSVELHEVNAYALPDLGEFDIGVLAAVLLHTRSPLSILEQVAKRVTGTIIITEPYNGNLAGPICRLVPGETNKTFDTWWNFTPEFFRQFLAAMGFSRSTVTRNFHRYCHANTDLEPFTLVARRG
jgi:O-methyltransferase